MAGIGMRRRSAQAASCLALAAFVAAGCGDGGSYKNQDRPPAPIVVGVSIGKDKVSASPQRFGAGPVDFIVTNQTGASQQVSVEISNGQAGRKGQTGPINPRDTGHLKINLEPPGTYTVKVDGGSIKPATLTVGPKRASAQNELQQP
jgi:hypothetical protein